MSRLTCSYCGSTINRSDTKCPYCGADIKETVMANINAEEKIEEEIQKKKDKLKKEKLTLMIAVSIIAFAFILSMMFIESTMWNKIILIISLVILFLIGLRQTKKLNSISKEIYELNKNKSENNNLLLYCEETEIYKVTFNLSNSLDNHVAREGFDQIAFKVKIYNPSNHTNNFTLYDGFFASSDPKFNSNHVSLSADGVRAEECDLDNSSMYQVEENKNFDPILYKKGFQDITIKPHESIVGWCAFYVPKGARKLELSFQNEVLVIDNPAK